LAAVGEGKRTHGLTVQADERVATSTDRAISIAMVVTELVTNALKYAYPEGETGEVRIILTKGEGDRASILVEDDGVGWNGSGTIKGTGLGSRIIQAMTKSLHAELSYRTEGRGTRVTLSFPL
jgi:two-component sensor histidine kinase